jgi:hypothetical protein
VGVGHAAWRGRGLAVTVLGVSLGFLPAPPVLQDEPGTRHSEREKQGTTHEASHLCRIGIREAIMKEYSTEGEENKREEQAKVGSHRLLFGFGRAGGPGSQFRFALELMRASVGDFSVRKAGLR